MDLFARDSISGRLLLTALVVLAVVLIGTIGARMLGRSARTTYGRYYTRKGVRYVVAVLAAIVLAVIWRPFAGQIGVVLGLFAAGVAFAAQEVIGAFAGWINIVWGKVFRVGDRVEMGGVRGDVIDITPLRTKILEMGAPEGSAGRGESWVSGRQYTGRVVAVSNKATFTQPVFNYSAAFEHLWEELAIPVRQDADWRRAEQILLEEVQAVSTTRGAREAIERMSRDFPVARTEVEPRVYVRVTDEWVELAARFVVPVRTARTVKDALTRRILDRLTEAGIEIAKEPFEARVAGSLRVVPGEESERGRHQGEDGEERRDVL